MSSNRESGEEREVQGRTEPCSFPAFKDQETEELAKETARVTRERGEKLSKCWTLCKYFLNEVDLGMTKFIYQTTCQ